MDSAAEVRLLEKQDHVTLSNGMVEVTLSKPGGSITDIHYASLNNLLEVTNPKDDRGYWDLVWSSPNGKGIFDVILGTEFKVIDHSPDKVEVSFVRRYNSSSNPTMVPLDVDKRFVLRRGDAGFYSYGIYERANGWPDFDLFETRIAFKLRKDRFQYMAVADSKQRLMPFPEDRLSSNSKQLQYPEAVLILKSKNPIFEGEVDDKYQYSSDNKNNNLHGWISPTSGVGFWVIIPSLEFRNGGISKQNLTSHVGPTCLAMFHSGHYAGKELYAQFRNGEAWKKVFGPVRIYLNSATDIDGPLESQLWEDAKKQLQLELQSWPYDWPSSNDYPKGQDRGTVKGRLLVQDRFLSSTPIPAANAVLGLAVPGDAGSWQLDSKGYQFWTEADQDGNFVISNVRPGTYNLYGWVPTIIGDFKMDGLVNVQNGQMDLREITYKPPRDGRTLWEIGVADRTAGEFFIPDPDPTYVNKLFINHPERYHQYGLWLQYSKTYPDNDLTYIIGKSDPSRDWFFAHVARIMDDGTLQPTTWRIVFQLEKVLTTGNYKLRLAVASSNNANIQVRVNDPTSSPPEFQVVGLGGDNAIARHGIHGLYHLFNIDIKPSKLKQGENTIYITQANTLNNVVGFMYDYIRLEEPNTIGTIDT